MQGTIRTYSRKRAVVAKPLQDASDLCRICLCKPNDAVPIFTRVPEIGISLATKITMCVGIEMSQDSHLPNQICTECVKELEQCYQFRKKCRTSYQKLQLHSDALKKSKIKQTASSMFMDGIHNIEDKNYTKDSVNDSSNITENNVENLENGNAMNMDSEVMGGVMNDSNANKLKDRRDSNVMNNSISNSDAIDSNETNDSHILSSNIMNSNSIKINISEIENGVKGSQSEDDTYFVNIQDNTTECMVEVKHPDRSKDENSSSAKPEKVHSRVANSSLLQRSNTQHVESHTNVKENCNNVHETRQPMLDVAPPAPTNTITINPSPTNADYSIVINPQTAPLPEPSPPSFLSSLLSSVLLAVGALHQEEHLFRIGDVRELELTLGDGTQLLMALEEEDGTGTSDNVSAHPVDRGSRRCVQCSRVFASCSARARHERAVHARARPYVCDTCGRAFAQRSVLGRHQMLHQDVRPFTCPVCNRSFRQRSGLLAHTATLHDPLRQPKSCPFNTCDKRFLHSSGLSRHIKWHEGRQFVCAECGRVFTDKSALRRHLASDRHKRLAGLAARANT